MGPYGCYQGDWLTLGDNIYHQEGIVCRVKEAGSWRCHLTSGFLHLTSGVVQRQRAKVGPFWGYQDYCLTLADNICHQEGNHVELRSQPPEGAILPPVFCRDN